MKAKHFRYMLIADMNPQVNACGVLTMIIRQHHMIGKIFMKLKVKTYIKFYN